MIDHLLDFTNMCYMLVVAQCNENVSSSFAIYHYCNWLRCILDRTAEIAVSVDCQSSNILYVPSPLPFRSSSSSFPIYLSAFEMIFSKLLIFFKWQKYFSFLRSRAQTAVTNIFNLLIFINLTFTVTVLKTILSRDTSFWIFWPILTELHSQKR